MATEVYTTEEIRLLDETEVILRPLPVSKLRKFTRMWSEHINSLSKTLTDVENPEDINEADMTDAQFDVFIKMCALGLESQLRGEKTEKQFASYLEDVLDEKTIYKILFITGGLNLGERDPNSLNQNLTVGDGII